MDITNQLLTGLTSLTPETPNDLSLYLSNLRQLIFACQDIPPKKAKLFIIGASHDIIRKARNNIDFPFMDPEFLKIIKAMLPFMSPEAIIAFSHIFPDKIKPFLQPKTQGEIRSAVISQEIQRAEEKAASKYKPAPKALKSNTAPRLEAYPPFLKDIIAHYSIRELLSIFALPIMGDEQQDRDNLSPYFLLLQELLAAYDTQKRTLFLSDSLSVICQVRGMVLLSYRMGLDYSQSLAIFEASETANIDISAEYIARIHFGNFISGMYILLQKRPSDLDASFLSEIYKIASSFGAYSLPLLLENVISPDPIPFPVITPMPQILSSKDDNLQVAVSLKGGDYAGDINIDIA